MSLILQVASRWLLVLHLSLPIRLEVPTGALTRNLTEFLRQTPDAWRIRAIRRAAREYDVDAPTLAALCTLESRVGLDPRGQHLWCGAMRASPSRQPYAAARALRQWRDRCRTPAGAIIAWRYGNGCRAPDPNRYAVRIMRLARRYARP